MSELLLRQGEDLMPWLEEASGVVVHVDDNTGPPDDTELVAQAMGFWGVTKEATTDPAKAFALMAERMAGNGIDIDQNPLLLSHALTQAAWAHYAYTKLVPSHKYASALMATTTEKLATADLEVQWPVFLVVIPDRLGIPYSRMLVDLQPTFRRGSWLRFPEFNLYTPGQKPHVSVAGPTVDKLLLGEALDMIEMARTYSVPGGLGEGEEFERLRVQLRDDVDKQAMLQDGALKRIVRACARLVSGLLLTMAHTNNFRVHVQSDRTSGVSRDGPPRHRVVFIGCPIALDCRETVRHYIERGHAPPSVQSLVRGHYKRQVIGVGRNGRKVIWVEPYWRGPEDAPILSRPRVIGG